MSSSTASPLYLTDEDVKKFLQWDTLIPVIETALKTVSQTVETPLVVQPPRTIMPVPDKNGVLLTMPGFSKNDDALACKLVTSFPDNAQKGMASIFGTVLLFDTNTGKVQAIMEANEITAWRTAAASAVATKYLHKGSDILAVLGSGVQARSHINALTHLLKFKEIRVWNHNQHGAEKLAAEFHELGKCISVCYSAEDAVKNADVIVTATYASSPILKRKWIKNGVHINGTVHANGAMYQSVGAGINHHSELDKELYQAASIYTDTMPAAQIELKGLADIEVSVLGEIGEIIQGTKHVPRENITVFHSLGMSRYLHNNIYHLCL
ncbi:Ketimine reductase mu-crystallin [Gryllus bimaculatus]|nr:Ketimine reductase mu-crystallin [Gryllus bimaculatus]